VARLIFAHRREYRGQLSKILETSGEALAHLGKEYETIAGIYETLSVYEAEGVGDSTSTVSVPPVHTYLHKFLSFYLSTSRSDYFPSGLPAMAERCPAIQQLLTFHVKHK
jgi:hypothetical protein